MILLKTNLGDIKLELDYENAPETAKNFEQYVREGFYDGLIFHRVIRNFMIQGGGFEPGMTPSRTLGWIENEADNGLSNKTGSSAKARSMATHSATHHVCITVHEQGFLGHSRRHA